MLVFLVMILYCRLFLSVMMLFFWLFLVRKVWLVLRFVCVVVVIFFCIFVCSFCIVVWI